MICVTPLFWQPPSEICRTCGIADVTFYKWRMGLPLEILIMLVSIPMILIVWPLSGRRGGIKHARKPAPGTRKNLLGFRVFGS